jgi:uncharacterized protein YciI
MKYVLLYESADDVISKVAPHVAAHGARLADFRLRGTLLMGGAFANPQEGALIIFTTREAAEEFVRGDPFVIHGVVRAWRIYAWNKTQFGPQRNDHGATEDCGGKS